VKTDLPVPAGFEVIATGAGCLVASSRHVQALRDGRFDDPVRWESELDGVEAAAGRGGTARVELASGVGLRVKQMRRGGLAGPLWRDRFAGTGRLLDNLHVPLVAAERGVPTAAPVALLLREGPPGFYRGWVAVEEIRDARDLISRLRSGDGPAPEELASAIELVRRMHEAGIEHRDLNLGNLLVRPGADRPEAFIIDLDRARVHDGPLPFRLRRRGIRRLERSYVKTTGNRGGEVAWHRLYAAGDPELVRRLERGRWVGRVGILLHGLSWRR